MPQFTYTARSRSGELVSGGLQAESQRAAIEKIRGQGQFPIKIESAETHVTARSRQVRSVDTLAFTRQLARLLESGVPLARGLELLAANSPNPAMRAVVDCLQDDVRSGTSLHDALAAHPHVFPELYSGMVRSGEASGTLSAVLKRLAEHYEKSRRISARIWNSLTYPLFMLGIGAMTVTFLITVVIPRFQKVFEDLGQTLPLPTRLLIGIGTFSARNWWLAPALAAAAYAVARSISRSPAARMAVHRLFLRIPVAGNIAKRTAMSRFMRVLGAMLQNGVPILTAINLAADNTGNLEIGRRLKPLEDTTREGVPLSAAFMKSGLFDPYTVDIIAVAEETGALPPSLIETADDIDEEVFNSLQRLMSLIEPALIVCLGVVVAIIVSAMLLPILQLNMSAL